MTVMVTPRANEGAQVTPERILNRLDWTVIRRLDGILLGDYRTLFYGFGLDLAEVREYLPEDDIRYMDWNVTARMNAPYVRQYHEDREIAAWFLLDLSPSVDFGTIKQLKRDLVIEFTATFSRLLTRHGNKVGAIVYDDHIEKIIPARSGKLHVLRLINDLLKLPRLKKAPYTDLTTLLDMAGRAIRRRSLIFIVSDFFSAPGWERPLRYLTQRHEVLAVQLYDPRERELPDVGLIVMEDAETGEQLYVNTSDKKFRKRFTEVAQKRQEALNIALRHSSVDVLPLSTEDDMVRAILRFASLRKQRKAHVRGR
jgi:uncharacterized protein (DUF58 family)